MCSLLLIFINDPDFSLELHHSSFIHCLLNISKLNMIGTLLHSLPLLPAPNNEHPSCPSLMFSISVNDTTHHSDLCLSDFSLTLLMSSLFASLQCLKALIPIHFLSHLLTLTTKVPQTLLQSLTWTAIKLPQKSPHFDCSSLHTAAKLNF